MPKQLSAWISNLRTKLWSPIIIIIKNKKWRRPKNLGKLIQTSITLQTTRSKVRAKRVAPWAHQWTRLGWCKLHRCPRLMARSILLRIGKWTKIVLTPYRSHLSGHFNHSKWFLKEDPRMYYKTRPFRLIWCRHRFKIWKDKLVIIMHTARRAIRAWPTPWSEPQTIKLIQMPPSLHLVRVTKLLKVRDRTLPSRVEYKYKLTVARVWLAQRPTEAQDPNRCIIRITKIPEIMYMAKIREWRDQLMYRTTKISMAAPNKLHSSIISSNKTWRTFWIKTDKSLQKSKSKTEVILIISITVNSRKI